MPGKNDLHGNNPLTYPVRCSINAFRQGWLPNLSGSMRLIQCRCHMQHTPWNGHVCCMLDLTASRPCKKALSTRSGIWSGSDLYWHQIQHIWLVQCEYHTQWALHKAGPSHFMQQVHTPVGHMTHGTDLGYALIARGTPRQACPACWIRHGWLVYGPDSDWPQIQHVCSTCPKLAPHCLWPAPGKLSMQHAEPGPAVLHVTCQSETLRAGWKAGWKGCMGQIQPISHFFDIPALRK